MRVLNFGSLNIDYVYRMDHLPLLGETNQAIDMEIYAGGKGLNQSVALACAGVVVYHAGLIGRDGDVLLEVLKKNNVNAKYVGKTKGTSGHAVVLVDRNGQNSIVTFGGSNREITPAYVKAVLNEFGKGDILLLQNEINCLNVIIELAYAEGMQIILNTAPCDNNIDECDLHKVSWLIMNETEGMQMTGEVEPQRILQVMLERYPDAGIVLTAGENGAYYQDRKASFHQPIYRVPVVDTTAAGDTFIGYFVYGLIQKMKMEEILSLCAKASAIAVSRKGASDSIPQIAELEGNE